MSILACDIQNAYLNSKCREKIYTIAGSEFRSEEGSIMIVTMALYGSKSSGAAFGSKLANVIYDLKYRPSLADPDVRLIPDRKVDGFAYYEYLLCYVDNVLMISAKLQMTIDGLEDVFKLKGGKAETPEMFLGASLAFVDTPTGGKCWSISAEKYVKTAVTNLRID